MKRYLVPYYRVSTDNKGQDAARQTVLCEPWAEREGFDLLPPELEEESALRVPALKRKGFIAACTRAQAARAEGILIETPDRFSRQDPDVQIWEKVEVERRYGVKLFFACMTQELQVTPMGKCFLFMQGAAGNQWVEDHRKKVLSGNVRARARGQQLGRKPKVLSFEEAALVDAWRADGIGWETCANKLCEARGVHLLTDKRVAKARAISASALKRWDRGRRAETAKQGGSAEMQNDTRDTDDGQRDTPETGGNA